jgi:hypothetical protein
MVRRPASATFREAFLNPLSLGLLQSLVLAMSAITKDPEVPVTVRKLSINAEEVREAIEAEHTLTFWEAAKLYPKAVGWSCYFSLGVIMLGRLANPKERDALSYIMI